MVTKKTTPSWGDVKAKLADFDRACLIGLVQDMYGAIKDNRAFLPRGPPRFHPEASVESVALDQCLLRKIDQGAAHRLAGE